MKVLLATDGSTTARTATVFAAAFPFPAGTEVTLLSVVADVLREHEIETLTPEQWEYFEATKSGTHDEINELMAADAEMLRRAGLTVTSEIREGHPAAEIVTAAEHHNADLIIVGSHGLTGFKRFMLGSVSSQVLHSAKRSVLIVRKPEQHCGETQPEPPSGPGHPWRLLMCYDGSPSAEKALEFCLSLEFDDRAAVEMLTVLPMVRMFRQDIRQELNWIWQDKVRSEQAALEIAADRMRTRVSDVTVELTEAGDVGHTILSEGEEFGADLIVLGHKGKGAIEKFLMGSVTPRVAQHACRSVLAVR